MSILLAAIFYAVLISVIILISRQSEREGMLDNICRRKCHTGELLVNPIYSRGNYLSDYMSVTYDYRDKFYEFKSSPSSPGIPLSPKREAILLANIESMCEDTCIVFALTEEVMDRFVTQEYIYAVALFLTQPLTRSQIIKYLPYIELQYRVQHLERHMNTIPEDFKIELQLRGLL